MHVRCSRVCDQVDDHLEYVTKQLSIAYHILYVNKKVPQHMYTGRHEYALFDGF